MERTPRFHTEDSPVEPVSSNNSFRGRKPRARFFSYSRVLLLIFLFSLPLVNPWVHGDGVGYYAFARSFVINHNLQFQGDWQSANESFVMGRVEANGEISPNQYTPTHHLVNNFAVGPAMLWAPFLAVVHLVITTLNYFGAHLQADGFSRPYIWTMALATAGYGFLGLWLSFCLARKYVAEQWAFLATVTYWFASSLPVYMYLNPSWSHAHSTFVVALFLWYWHRTRGLRSLGQWVLLGLIAALMVNVYYPNGILLILPAFEALSGYVSALRKSPPSTFRWSSSIRSHLIFLSVFLVGMLPTLITKKIIYGHFLTTGYESVHTWDWTHPVFGSVLFSSDHGLLSWTPIIILALVGLVLFRRLDWSLALYLWAVFIFFLYVISCYLTWDGITSFGNRFFLSLGPIFILGLAALFDRVGRLFKNQRKANLALGFASILFVVWNLAFIFQWGDHLIPVRGPISWRTMVYNQFYVVPGEIWNTAESYLFHRKRFLHQIEEKDIQEIKKGPSTTPEP